MITNNEVAISLKSVKVTYRSGIPLFKRRSKHEVLKGVTFDIYRGETVGIIGRNGAGKSTLLKLLNGIIKPDEGHILNYHVTTNLLALNPGYDGYVSGRNNALYHGMLLGLNKASIVNKMQDIIKFSELESYIDQPIKNYSSGMVQRLGFAVASQLESDVLLIDEILSVGDARFKEKSKRVMKEKIQDGRTVVLVSHNAVDVIDLCDRVIWIENGVVFKEGCPVDVLKSYSENARKYINQNF